MVWARGSRSELVLAKAANFTAPREQLRKDFISSLTIYTATYISITSHLFSVPLIFSCFFFFPLPPLVFCKCSVWCSRICNHVRIRAYFLFNRWRSSSPEIPGVFQGLISLLKARRSSARQSTQLLFFLFLERVQKIFCQKFKTFHCPVSRLARSWQKATCWVTQSPVHRF